ncbi:helix-hairpin-helix domain-containing protein [Avibacterium avium]|uniref:helix-hairpin-helix domain-containing protein n=1 Tax=Avibacterium avium TaxID=751 RepID=UPI003BF903E2
MMKMNGILATLLLGFFSCMNAFAEPATEPTPPATQETVQTAVEKSPVFVGNMLNINTATASEIQKALVGIGAKKAEAIVEYREKHGNFIALEQLLEVQGIGKATLEKNKDRIQL